MTRYKTMTEIAVEYLREKILMGELPKEAKLVPAKLESEINVGKVAIREAIRELAGSGLVVSYPNKGTYVAMPPLAEEVKYIFQCRSVLEGILVYQATLKISKEEYEELKSLNDKMISTGSPKKFFLYNQKFHLKLCAISECKYLLNLAKQLTDQILLYRSANVIKPTDKTIRDEFCEYHRKILEAIDSKDPEKARLAIIENLDSGCKHLLDKIEDGK